MSILGWIILGLVAGFLARAFLPGPEPGPGGIIGDLIAGLIGALLGGWLFRILGIGKITGLNFWSFVIAFVGAVIFLLIWRAASRRGHYGARPT